MIEPRSVASGARVSILAPLPRDKIAADVSRLRRIPGTLEVVDWFVCVRTRSVALRPVAFDLRVAPDKLGSRLLQCLWPPTKREAAQQNVCEINKHTRDNYTLV